MEVQKWQQEEEKQLLRKQLKKQLKEEENKLIDWPYLGAAILLQIL